MRHSLLFYINDQQYEIDDGRAGWTLAEFLRQECRLVATKVVCAEGDCGSCTVLVGRERPGCQTFAYQPIDSCIVFLYQLDRTHVVTVEGLTYDDILSPVQQAMVDCHGSQCGFCTPGFVTALHGMLEEQRAASNGNMSLSDEQLREGLSGNLCRCTGYVQILDAGKQIEPAAVPPLAQRYDPREMLAAFHHLPTEPVHIRAPADDPLEVFVPRRLDEAIDFKARHPAAKVVAGATDVGVLRNHGRLQPDVVLALGSLMDFRQITIDEDDVLHIGAGATWTEVLTAIDDRLPEFSRILRRFGSPQIRHLATIGGNLVNASPIADSLPLLYVLDAQLETTGPQGLRRIPVDKFYLGYKQLDLGPTELLAAVHVPLPRADEDLKLYKVSKRRDLDISTVTAGMWYRVENDLIVAARFAAGGVGPTVLRLPRAEAYVCGLPCSETTFHEAGRIARQEVRPITDVRAGAEYRSQLVENLFCKAYFDR